MYTRYIINHKKLGVFLGVLSDKTLWSKEFGHVVRVACALETKEECESILNNLSSKSYNKYVEANEVDIFYYPPELNEDGTLDFINVDITNEVSILEVEVSSPRSATIEECIVVGVDRW